MVKGQREGEAQRRSNWWEQGAEGGWHKEKLFLTILRPF